MRWKTLKQMIEAMDDEQMEMDVTIYDPCIDEFFGVTILDKKDEDFTPFLVADRSKG